MDLELFNLYYSNEQDITKPSCSPWSFLVVMAEREKGTLHFCVDYRHLNNVTIEDAHPLQKIDDTLEALQGAKLITTLDLQSWYWQVPLYPEFKEKTGFCTSMDSSWNFNTFH